MKEITFELGYRNVHRYEATEDDNLARGENHYMDLERFNHYLELEKRITSDDYTDEDDDEWFDFECGLACEGESASFIPKDIMLGVSVKDLSKNTEENFLIEFEKHAPGDEYYPDGELVYSFLYSCFYEPHNYGKYKTIFIPPSEKIEDPYFKPGKFLVHCETSEAFFKIKREDFDPAKFVVKEYFHKAEKEAAVAVYYDGIDLLNEACDSEDSVGALADTYSQIFE